MRNLIMLLVAVILFGTSGRPQEQRIEIDLMNCVYQGYSDTGVKLKRLISDYEKLLITEKIISDNSGKSYVTAFRKIADKEDFNFTSSESLVQQWSQFEKPNQEKIKACQAKLLPRTQTTKDDELIKLIDSLVATNGLEPYTAAAGILSILNDQDLELDYYKLKTFFVFSLIQTDEELSNETPEIDIENLNDALEIYLNEKNEIFVNEKKVTIDELKVLVKDHEAANKSKSHFYLNSSRDTRYGFYQQVQMVLANMVKELRNELSKAKHGISFEELDEEKAKEIKSMYPIHLREEF